MEESRNGTDEQCSTWYVVVPAIGYAKQRQGEPLPLPPKEDPGKARLNSLLKDFAAAILDEAKEAGAIPFNRLWCGGDCTRVLLAPGTPGRLEAITEKKAQLKDLEQTVRQFAPQRYAEVASEWERFRPAAHMLVMEARPVFLPGEQAEMQAEADEMFGEACGDPALRPSLTELTEASEDDPDRWYVIIGWLKLAGLDGVRCAEIDSLNWHPEDGLEAKSPDRQRAKGLVRIFLDVAPEMSTGAWFDLDDVHRAWQREQDHGGRPEERFIGVARLGGHLNNFWCCGPKGIKGPYFLPRAEGIAARLAEGRRSYRQAVAERAKQDGEQVRSLMLMLEVRSPWLGQAGSDEPQRLRQWFAAANRGSSLLSEVYWEAPWDSYSPLPIISRPHRPPGETGEAAEESALPPGWQVAEGRWAADAAGRIVGGSDGNAYIYREQEHADDFRVTATMRAVEGIEITVWICGSPERTEMDGYTLAVSTEKAKLQRQGEDAVTDATVTIQPGEDHVLGFERHGAVLRGFLDGAAEPFIEWTDPDPLRGAGHRTLGFYMWDGTLAVSDIQVEELKE